MESIMESSSSYVQPPNLNSAQSGSALPEKDALLFDSEICTALGMTMESGMCLRHPNICIYQCGSLIQESQVHTCKICDSETKGGGIRQRKSFAFAIQQIQEIHGTPQWQHFKDAWGAEDTIESGGGGGGDGVSGTGSGSSNNEEKKGESPATSIVFEANRELAEETIDTRNMRPSATLNQVQMPRLTWTKQILKRAAQVASWKSAYQDAESVRLQKELRELKWELSKEQEGSATREASLKSIVEKQTLDMEELQKKCDKQEGYINKELRMIKSIAMKRASSRGSLGDRDRECRGSGTGNNSGGESSGGGNTSSGDNDVAMKQPYRKVSDAADKVAASAAGTNTNNGPPSPGANDNDDSNSTDDINEIQSPTTVQSSSDVLSPESLKSSGAGRQMPGREKRLSSLTLTDVSVFHVGSPKSLPLSQQKYDFDQDRSPPSQPQRLPSQDTALSTVSDLTGSLVTDRIAGGGAPSSEGGGGGTANVEGSTSIHLGGQKDFGKIDIQQMTPSTILSAGSSPRKHQHKIHDIAPSIKEGDDEEEDEDGNNSELMDRVPSKLIETPVPTSTQAQQRRQYRQDIRTSSPNRQRDISSKEEKRRARSDATPGGGTPDAPREFNAFRSEAVTNKEQQEHYTRNNRSTDQEISFVPTQSEVNVFASSFPSAPTAPSQSKPQHPVPPPPPPPPPPGGGILSPTIGNKSQEIRFDASHDLQTEGVDKRRRSLMGMKFDTSQRLLMEAKEALADPSMTPTLKSARKMHSESPAVTQHKEQLHLQQRMSLSLSQAAGGGNHNNHNRHGGTSNSARNRDIDLGNPSTTPSGVDRRISLSLSQALGGGGGGGAGVAGAATSTSAHNRDINLGNSHVALSGFENDSILHGKTEEEIFNEKIFGKIEKATPENEADDEYDYFEDLPSDLGLTSEGYLQVRNSFNSSPVSAITTGSLSYLLDHQPGGYDDDEDDDDDDGPRKGLHQAGFAKRLPMEEDFDSDDDDTGGRRTIEGSEGDFDDDESTSNGASARINDLIGDAISMDDINQEDVKGNDDDDSAPLPVKLTSSHVGSPPIQQMKSTEGRKSQQDISIHPEERKQPSLIKPKAQRTSVGAGGDSGAQNHKAQLRTLSEGFNKPAHTLSGRPKSSNQHHGHSGHSRQKTKATILVQEEIVQDKYGDGGIYTGSIAADDRLPHGNGRMAYDNERQYDGEWRRGRWHGIGKWVNPNGDCYEGTFVYDARHGRGTYTWKNGNVYKGDFHEDKRQGKGTFNFANGNVYEGDFINGVFEGQGRYRFEGGFYEGGWKGGRYNNHGYLKFADGSSYTGEFVDGVAHGHGEEKAADGTVRTGYWENGRPISSMEPL